MRALTLGRWQRPTPAGLDRKK